VAFSYHNGIKLLSFSVCCSRLGIISRYKDATAFAIQQKQNLAFIGM
jgi:hypothetical protein